MQQGEVLGQGEVLAVPGALGQGLHGRGPVVAPLPEHAVVAEAHLAVDLAVDRLQLLLLWALKGVLQEVMPGLQAFTGRAAAAVALFRLAQHGVEAPGGLGDAGAEQQATADCGNGHQLPEKRRDEAAGGRLLQRVDSPGKRPGPGSNRWINPLSESLARR
ncbi:hypothetical protein D3C81_1786460 [compost metagenome]